MKDRTPALFLDRDGTLIREVHFLSDPEKIEILPGAVEAVRRMNQAGVPVVIFTNQSGVARGLFSEERLLLIHRRLVEKFSEQKAHFHGIYYCPHHPEGTLPAYRKDCGCRKPLPGLLLRAQSELNLDLARSVVVGDSLRDLQAGRSAGTRTVLVLSGYGAEELGHLRGSPTLLRPDHIASDILGAVDWALEQMSGESTG